GRRERRSGADCSIEENISQRTRYRNRRPFSHHATGSRSSFAGSGGAVQTRAWHRGSGTGDQPVRAGGEDALSEDPAHLFWVGVAEVAFSACGIGGLLVGY